MLSWVIALVTEVQPIGIIEDTKDGKVQFSLIYDTAITHLPSPGGEVTHPAKDDDLVLPILQPPLQECWGDSHAVPSSA